MSQEKSKSAGLSSADPQNPNPPMAQVDVPAFPCIVHLEVQDGVYRGRVANLAGIEAVASTEREMLGKIVPLFKSAVAEIRQRGDCIPWITPVPEPRSTEIKRFIPVHL